METTDIRSYQEAKRLSAYRDLKLYPGYQYLIDDLRQLQNHTTGQLVRSSDWKESLRTLRMFQFLSVLIPVLETRPEEAATELEKMLGDMSAEQSFYMAQAGEGVN